MIDFACESFADTLDELRPLALAHWSEVAIWDDPLDPDWDWYCTNPHVRLYTVREDGELIGYASFFVVPSRHHKGTLHAVQDAIWLRKDRRGVLGAEFIVYCEQQARAEGASAIYMGASARHDWTSVLERLGYQRFEIMEAKRLDRSQ